MVHGVTEGYTCNLEIQGVGYRAAKQGNKLVLSLGYSHPIEVEPAPGIEIEVPTPTRISIKGVDKELVGQTAAIFDFRRPEPYLEKVFDMKENGSRKLVRQVRQVSSL